MVKKPFLIILLGIFSFSSTLKGQTTLSAGEIAIIAMNCDGDDSFSFVLLRDITNGTVITFSESGWLSAGGFRGGGDGSEGAVTWTATSDLTCGTEISITSAATVASTGSLSLSGSWGLSASGDQILAYQGAFGSPTFIYALNNNGAGVWQADATSTTTSAIPTGLTNGTNAVAVNEADNVKYDCSTTTPVAASLAAISNNTNWLSNNATPYAVPINCGFTCAAPCTGPTSQATFTSITGVTTTSMTINFGAGTGGNGRIVVISNAAITASPTSGTTYTANTVYGSGTDIGTNEFVVYDGTGTSVTVTGLTANTTYYVEIFEYVTGGATDPCYDDVTGGNTGNSSTLCVAGTEPTTAASSIVFSTVDCTYMIIDWTTGNGGNTIVVVSTSAITGNPTDQTSYTANSTFGSGSTLNAGEFVVYNGNGTSVTVFGLVAGTTYNVEIFEYNVTTTNCDENYLTSATVSSSQATASVCCPQINSILVNSCGASTSEGIDEQVIFTTGSNTLSINNISITYPFAGSYCNTTCGGNTNLNNAAFVTSLNTTAGCTPDLFYYADPIPANSTVIMFMGLTPSTVVDYSGICGSGPYYVVFNNNANTGGRFANAANANRTTTMNFGGGCSQTVTFFSSNANTGTDGDYAYFDALGNPSYGNNGLCVAGPLPIELLNFEGHGENNTNFLNWSTASEINNDYFTLERSKNGIDFESIGTVFGSGTSTQQNDYSFTDESPLPKLNYYRLKQTDFDGKYSYSQTIVLKNESDKISIWHANNELHVITPQNKENLTLITVYNALGQLIFSEHHVGANLISTTKFNKGIYIVKVTTENTTVTKKIKF